MRLFAHGGGRLPRRAVLKASVVALLAGLISASSLTQPGAVEAPQEQPLSNETIAARQHYFGLDNVNPRTGAVRRDRVILSWMGVSSFAAAFNGHVVLLDAWIPRPSACFPAGVPCSPLWNHSMRYVGSTPEELAALKPEAYFFGHAHFDHVGDLPTVIRANPDVLVLGTEEHCNDIEQAVTDVEFRCLQVFPAGAEVGEVTRLPRKLLSGVGVTAVKQPHSSRPSDPEADPPFSWPPEECFAFDQYPPDPTDPLSFGGPTSGSIAIAWQFRVGKFALVWQDTAGPIRGTAVPEAFASLPQTDVRLGSVVVSGRSVMNDHLEALAPKLFIPLHGDPCFFLIRKEVEEQLATLPADRRPMMWFISDPGDFLRPISFDPRAPVWR
jgi:hypothetical protein